MFCRLEEFLVLLLLLLWTLKTGGATMHFQPLLKAQKQVLTKNYVYFFFIVIDKKCIQILCRFQKMLDLVIIFI